MWVVSGRIARRAPGILSAITAAWALVVKSRSPWTTRVGAVMVAIGVAIMLGGSRVLTRALEVEPLNRPFDVGGDEVLTYPELLHLFASITGLWRPQVTVPFVPTRLVGWAVSLIAQMPRATISALVESLSSDLVCADDAVRRELAAPDHRFLGIEEALRRSLRGPSQATSTSLAPSKPNWPLRPG